MVFAKAPILGQVKTRLQPLFSQQQSVELHQQLVHGCLQVAAMVGNYSTDLWVGSEHDWWASLSEQYDVDLLLQRGNDLGERMSQAFEQTLPGVDKALLIGTDCPFITEGYLLEAFAQLDNCDVVIGPAEDGGYVLIGLSANQPALFQGISWGTDQVLAETINLIDQHRLSYVLLPVLRDIDRPEDVVYWRSQQALSAAE